MLFPLLSHTTSFPFLLNVSSPFVFSIFIKLEKSTNLSTLSSLVNCVLTIVLYDLPFESKFEYTVSIFEVANTGIAVYAVTVNANSPEIIFLLFILYHPFFYFTFDIPKVVLHTILSNNIRNAGNNVITTHVLTIAPLAINEHSDPIISICE